MSAPSPSAAAPSPVLPRLLGALEWCFAAGFVALRPLVASPTAEASGRFLNILLEMIAALPLLFLALRWALGGAPARGGGTFALAALGLWGALGLSAAWGLDPGGALPKLSSWTAGLAVAAWAALAGARTARKLLWVLLAGAALSVFVGVFQSLGEHRLIQEETRRALAERAAQEGPVTEPDWYVSMREGRIGTDEIFGTFYPFYPNTFAGYLAMLLPLWVGALADAERSRRPLALRAILLLLLAGTLWCLARTGSLGGYVAGAAGLALFGCLSRGVPFRRIAAFAAAAAGLGAAAYAAGLRHPSVEVRLGYWTGALAMAWDRIWTGVGLAGYPHAAPFYRPAGATEARHAHNDLLEGWAEGGVVLALALCLFWRFALARRPRADAESAGAEAAPGLPFAWGAVCAALALPLAVWMRAFLRSDETDSWVLLAAAASTAALALWTLSAGRGAPPWGSGTERGIRAGLGALLLHALQDFDFQASGIVQTALPLAGILWGASCPEAASPPRMGRRLQAAVVAAAGVAGLLHLGAFSLPRLAAMLALDRVESRRPGTGPDELRELAGMHLDRAVALTPWDTELLQTRARLREELWRMAGKDRRDADWEGAVSGWREIARRRPLSGAPPLQLAMLHASRPEPARRLEALAPFEDAARLLPRFPTVRFELALHCDRLRADSDALAAYAGAEELLETDAAEDLLRRARRAYAEAVELEPAMRDPQHRLGEARLAFARKRISEIPER